MLEVTVQPIDGETADAATPNSIDPQSWRKGHGRVFGDKIVYPPHPKGRHHCWKTRLSYLLHRFGHDKVRTGAKASDKTYTDRRERLFAMFDALRKAGFKLEDPANLDARHVRYLLGMWEERWRAGQAGDPEGLSGGTIANLVSHLRTFCAWIGQPQLMDLVEFEKKDLVHRQRAASKDMSWEGNGVDPIEVIDRCWSLEQWVAVALLMQFTLGLRHREAVMFRPAVAHQPGEAEVSINVLRSGVYGLNGLRSGGSKGGRGRMIPLTAQWQHDVLDFARMFVSCHGRQDGYLGANGSSLLANMKRYQRVLEDLGITKEEAGVTGHGLRHEFAIRALNRHGLEAPVRGGDLQGIGSDERRRIQVQVSESLGHSRPQITTAYYGSVKVRGEVKSVETNPDDAIAPRVEALLEKWRGLYRQQRKGDLEFKRYLRAIGKA